LELRRVTHRTVAAVTDALDSFAFNVAVARVHELANATERAERAEAAPELDFGRLEAVEMLCRLISPMMPHLAEALGEQLHGPGTILVAERPWPEADAMLLAVETVTIAVQVMGKLRGSIEVPADADEAFVLAAAASERNVAKALDGLTISKRIYVPGRIVNFVAHA